MATRSISKILSAAPRRAALLRREFSALVSPCEEFPGLPVTTPEAAKASSPSVTTLPNGLTVVTEDAASSSTVSLTFPKGGSKDEMIDEHGAAFMNKTMSFKSGSGLSSILILRNIEDDGGTPFSTASRFGATVGYTCARENAPRLVPLLATTCAFEKWDVKDGKEEAGYEIQVANESAQLVLTEQIFAAAYGPQSPAGRPFYFSDVSLGSMMAFRERNYGVNGAVLAATGVSDHEAFVTMAGDATSEALAGSGDAAAETAYLGGESRVAAPSSGYAHVAVAFDAKTLSTPVRCVLKACMDLAGAESGVSAFETTGLVGLYAGASTDAASGLVDSVAQVMTTAPSADIIKRAKAIAKAQAMFALDDGSKSLAEVMTAAVLETGTFSGAAGVSALYDAVTDKDLADAVAVLRKSNPSLACVGDISTVPYHASIASNFA